MTDLTAAVAPDAEAFLANLRRDRTPKRVHNMELFLDGEIKQAMDDIFTPEFLDLFDEEGELVQDPAGG